MTAQQQHNRFAEVSQYGIFETSNGWLTQAVVIEPYHRVLLTGIQLRVNEEDKAEPDILIGQMVSSGHSLASTNSVISGFTANMNAMQWIKTICKNLLIKSTAVDAIIDYYIN